MKLNVIKNRAGELARSKTDFPILETAATLWERLLQDRLALTASSLTYTTVLALVPLFTVVLSVFTLFPIFDQMEGALQDWLVASLIPESIAGNVMEYLTQFASKASQLGLLGIIGLAVTSLSLILTIDKTLNQIWRASSRRPLAQRILVYWAALTLGPIIMGASIAITSYAVTLSQGWLPGRLSGGVDHALKVLQFGLMTTGLTLLYRFVPNTPVRWRHALVGAIFVTLALGLARWGLGVYLSHAQTYAKVYGTFAAVPLLLLWIYVSWLIVLFGAVIAAYLPTLLGGVSRRGGTPGWRLELAMEALHALERTRDGERVGLTLPQLTRELGVDALQLRPILDELRSMDWVGELATRRENEEPRHALLVDPARQVMGPLLDRLLLQAGPALAPWWQVRGLRTAVLGEVLACVPAGEPTPEEVRAWLEEGAELFPDTVADGWT